MDQSAKDLDAKDLAAKDLSDEDLADMDLAAENLAATDLAAKDLAAKDLPANNGPGYSRRRLYFYACSVYTLFLGVGLVMGWPSPSVPKLKEEQANYTSSQYALLASIPGLAPGPLLTIFGIDSIGRKWTLFIIWVTTVISPVIMLLTRDITLLLIARFIGGWGMGAGFSVIGIYISEIADAGIRGPLNSLSVFFLTVGVVTTTSVTPFTSFQNSTIVVLVLSSIFGLFWWFLPESPYYLAARGRYPQARSIIKKIKAGGTAEFIDKELELVKFSIEEEKKKKHGIKKLFTSSAVYRQFAVSFLLLYLQQGANAFTNYGQELFDSAKLNGAYVQIGMTCAGIIVMTITPFLIKSFGTKTLFMTGGFGSGSSLILMGINFIFLKADYDLSSIRYLPIVLQFMLLIFVYTGLGGAVWGTVSELFSPSVKGPASGICGIFSTLMGFVVSQVFGVMKDKFGFGVTILGFGIVQIVAAMGLFLVPDTSKMTLLEIQDYFEKKASKD